MARGQKNRAGQVRIIAGQWRGRKLPVQDLPGLRPTSDRGREILFNWLQPYIVGAHCADLFAGTGVLGFEAASRGASHVDMVEIAPLAVSSLVDSRSRLGADNVEVHRDNAMHWLNAVKSGSLDIVFVDPPFDSGLAIQTIVKLQESDCMASGGIIYVESPSRFPELVMQVPFELIREKVVGESRMQLFRKIAHPG